MNGKECKRITLSSLFLLVATVLPLAAQIAQPPGFTPPPLNPTGTHLVTHELAPGVYALLSDKPPVDNSGFVVGERGVLVIDAHINGTMAREIQAAVRQVTSKPMLYLVNTNFFGDHWFGNYAFPAETLIVAQRETAQRLSSFELIKQGMLAAVDNDATVFADVRPRYPDVVFEDYLRLDLGGRVVELYHFGPGNTPGDTVVYLPDAKVAWTGNLILSQGSIPILFQGGAPAYLETLARMRRTLDVTTMVPGHGQMASGAILGRYLRYLSDLVDSVRQSIRDGRGPEETVASNALGAEYLPASNADSPLAEFAARFFTGVHRLNVLRTYEEFTRRQ